MSGCAHSEREAPRLQQARFDSRARAHTNTHSIAHSEFSGFFSDFNHWKFEIFVFLSAAIAFAVTVAIANEVRRRRPRPSPLLADPVLLTIDGSMVDDPLRAMRLFPWIGLRFIANTGTATVCRLVILVRCPLAAGGGCNKLNAAFALSCAKTLGSSPCRAMLFRFASARRASARFF